MIAEMIIFMIILTIVINYNEAVDVSVNRPRGLFIQVSTSTTLTLNGWLEKVCAKNHQLAVHESSMVNPDSPPIIQTNDIKNKK